MKAVTFELITSVVCSLCLLTPDPFSFLSVQCKLLQIAMVATTRCCALRRNPTTHQSISIPMLTQLRRNIAQTQTKERKR